MNIEKGIDQASYNERPDKEARIVDLSEKFDNDNKDLLEALRGKEDLYYKKRAEYVAVEMGRDEDAENINNLLEDRTEAYFKSLIEETTGLKRREALYRDMDAEIANIFEQDNVKNLSDEEFLDIIMQQRADDYKDVELNAMMGDMAYLSLANEEGHRVGDKLLGRTGEVIHQELRNASRHGGDEFTALIKAGQEEADKKVARLESAIEESKNISVLKDNNLKPKLDIGLAHFSEGLSAFQEVVREMEKTPEGKKKLMSINILKEFEDTWLEIADKRSALKKAFERTKQLIDLRRDRDGSEAYIRVIDFLRKGAFGIKDDEVDGLIGRIDSGEPLDDVVDDFITGKEKTNMSKLNGHRLIRAQIIKNIVG